MKAKVGPVEIETTEKDYDAIQKVSKIGIFQILSDQFGYWRRLNLIRISEKFKKKCEKRGIDPKQVSPKFLAQFIEAASLDEDESIQEIWASILAEEAQEPGSVSLRTIASLKALSKDEADAFQSLYNNALQFDDGNLAIYNDRRKNKTSISDIIKLVDCGLLVSESTNITMNLSMPPKSKRIAFLSITGKYVAIIQNNEEEERKCAIPFFSLTRAGQDILRATFAKDRETDILLIAKWIKEANKALTVGLFEIKKYDKKTGQIDYTDKNILDNHQ